MFYYILVLEEEFIKRIQILGKQPKQNLNFLNSVIYSL